VRDYFDLLGLSTTARATEIRRRTALHPRRWHPDFGIASVDPPVAVEGLRADAAVDFVSMLSFVDRMQRAFFVDVPPAVPASSE
jgi:hypothetical protein